MRVSLPLSLDEVMELQAKLDTWLSREFTASKPVDVVITARRVLDALQDLEAVVVAAETVGEQLRASLSAVSEGNRAWNLVAGDVTPNGVTVDAISIEIQRTAGFSWSCLESADKAKLWRLVSRHGLTKGVIRWRETR